jgi:hypothetical protein
MLVLPTDRGDEMKVQTLAADLRRRLRPRGFTGEIIEAGHRDYEAARRV